MASPLLQGTAFISGAASGIGMHTALAFAKYGVTKLALADINLEALEASIEALRKTAPDVEVLALRMDVRKATEVKAGLALAVEKFGRLDIAVNNAGISGLGSRTDELDDEEWDRILDINLSGVYRCQKTELAVMKGQEDLGPRRGRGAIINVASMYGLVGPRSPLYQTAYTTSKHGVMGLTRADANAYSELNIRINAVCPGYVETPMVMQHLVGNPENPINEHITQTPMRRLAMPDEVADSISFLASPMSSFIHGTGLVVDGGFTSV